MLLIAILCTLVGDQYHVIATYRVLPLSNIEEELFNDVFRVVFSKLVVRKVLDLNDVVTEYEIVLFVNCDDFVFDSNKLGLFIFIF